MSRERLAADRTPLPPGEETLEMPELAEADAIRAESSVKANVIQMAAQCLARAAA